MKKAVGYFRVSTDKVEQKESIKNQELIFMDYIKKQGFELCRFYIDEGITATGKEKRPAFDQMAKDIDTGEFDIIIVKELSRLARNVEIANWTKRKAIDKDVRILSIDNLVDTFDSGKNMMFNTIANQYEMESRITSSRIKASFLAKQKNGQFIGSIPPYGYVVKDKKLFKRNDYTENVVKEIFSLYLEDWGQEKIARYLDKKGYPTPAQIVGKSNAGRFWHGTTVKKILTNYHYLGHLVQHRETSKDITIAKRKQVPKDEMIWVRNTHEPIIDEAIFNLVQEKIEYKKRVKDGNSKSKTVRSYDNRHLFTGFLFCGECGSPYWYKKNPDGYFCGARIKRGRVACDNDIIREKQLINLIKRDVKSFLTDDIKIDVDKKLRKEEQKSQRQIDSLTNKINNLKRKNKKYLDLLADEIISKSDYKSSVEINNDEVKKLQQEINTLSSELKKERLDISSIKSQLEDVIKLETFDRELINLLVNRIEVSKSGELKVFYTFSHPKVYNHKTMKSIS